MKILFFIEHFENRGGAEKLAVSLCKQLYKRGYEIHVVCKDGEENNFAKLHKKFPYIRDAVKEIRPDITFDWGLFERADISRLGGGIHEIFLKYSLISYPLYLRPIKWIYYKMWKHQKKIRHQRYVLQAENTIYIAPSYFVKTQALQYGIEKERVRVIYNGIDIEEFSPADHNYKLAQREKWGIKEDEVVFLFVAHNLRLKNISLLKRVFAQLSEKYPNIRLIVVGRKMPDLRGIPAIYTGVIKDMPEIYKIADVLVHPSYFDTFGTVVLEAMASGIPVIVSNLAGSSEIVEDGGVVLPVIGEDVEKLWKEALEEMLEKEIRLSMGLKARNIAQKYSILSYTDKIEELIKEAK